MTSIALNVQTTQFSQIAGGEFCTTCLLKWFNESKGFGFVVPKDAPDRDAFIHVSTLQQLNIKALGENAELVCQIAPTDRGLQVTKVIELSNQGRCDVKLIKIPLAPNAAPTYSLAGTVKWYSKEKGYGFIAADDGLKDIFIHQSCLQRNHVFEAVMLNNCRVMMSIRDVEQGREVVTIKVI